MYKYNVYFGNTPHMDCNDWQPLMTWLFCNQIWLTDINRIQAEEEFKSKGKVRVGYKMFETEPVVLVYELR